MTTDEASPAPHAHLWVLADGTPVHAPPGRLSRNDEGQVCCHLCGRWFDHLGAHLRRHGWTAARYRQAVGLAAGRALCHRDLSQRIARRQSAHWESVPDVRAAFDHGRTVGVRALTDPDRDRTPATEVAVAAAATLTVARRHRDADRLAALARLAAGDGFDDVDRWLRRRYETGASLAALQRLTRWSRPTVVRHLRGAGAVIRTPGQTTVAGRAHRTAVLHARVVARVGTDDVDGWLRAGVEQGLTHTALARRAGRSTTWVRTRLAAAADSVHRTA